MVGTLSYRDTRHCAAYNTGMSSIAAPPGLISIEDYLELDENSTVRYEYVGGMDYALAGGTDRHNRIALNIAALLLSGARGGPCRVYISDMKLLVRNVSYPDVMVAREPPETDNPTARSNPCLLVEVLSPSTGSTDRHEKMLVYQDITILRAYLIVHQDTQRVVRHYRGKDGVWRRADHVTDGAIAVSCPETDLTLARIYEGL